MGRQPRRRGGAPPHSPPSLATARVAAAVSAVFLLLGVPALLWGPGAWWLPGWLLVLFGVSGLLSALRMAAEARRR